MAGLTFCCLVGGPHHTAFFTLARLLAVGDVVETALVFTLGRRVVVVVVAAVAARAALAALGGSVVVVVVVVVVVAPSRLRTVGNIELLALPVRPETYCVDVGVVNSVVECRSEAGGS